MSPHTPHTKISGLTILCCDYKTGLASVRASHALASLPAPRLTEPQIVHSILSRTDCRAVHRLQVATTGHSFSTRACVVFRSCSVAQVLRILSGEYFYPGASVGPGRIGRSAPLKAMGQFARWATADASLIGRLVLSSAEYHSARQ